MGEKMEKTYVYLFLEQTGLYPCEERGEDVALVYPKKIARIGIIGHLEGNWMTLTGFNVPGEETYPVREAR